MRDRLVAVMFVLAAPAIALADGNVCMPLPAQPPPSSPITVPIDPTDPTPIIVDCSVGGVTLTGAPDAAATAVTNGNSLVIRTVSPATAADPNAHPGIVAAPTPATATVTLDVPVSLGVDALGNSCVLASISDVQPAGGFLPAGSVITVAGSGFAAGAQAQIDGVAAASVFWVDSSHMQLVTAVDAQLDGSAVSVVNPDGTGATYVVYPRATDLGQSANPLIAATQTIFPVQTDSSALFATPATGTFFGLAIENRGSADSVISIDLWDAGTVIASSSFTLPAGTRLSREVSELFPGIASGASSVYDVTATAPVQVMGLSGDATDGSVAPVLPALASP